MLMSDGVQSCVRFIAKKPRSKSQEHETNVPDAPISVPIVECLAGELAWATDHPENKLEA